MSRLFFIISVLNLCFLSSEVNAELASFVADAVQSVPGQEQRRGKLYVSDLGTRFEFIAKKQKVIQIIQPQKGLLQLLFPKSKTYFEIKTPPPVLQSGRSRLPCKSSPKIECIQQGRIISNKMSYQRWLVRDRHTKTTMRGWWDPVRHMYIRQFFSNGSKMIAEKQGVMQFEGRTVERWKMTVFLRNRRRLNSYMLFSLDLGFPVMERGGAGLVKELHNIKPHIEDPAHYKIPSGYKKLPYSPKK